MTLDDLMREISKAYGFETFEPDDRGVYALEVDGMPVTIVPDEDGRGALLTSAFTTVPEHKKHRLAREILRLNHLFTGGEGASFSLDPATKDYCLQQSVALPETIEPFVEAVEHFLARVDTWQVFFEDAFEEHHDPAKTPSATTQASEESGEETVATHQWIAV